eukprot:6192450-Pleurochrysis_carterae.AAC.1
MAEVAMATVAKVAVAMAAVAMAAVITCALTSQHHPFLHATWLLATAATKCSHQKQSALAVLGLSQLIDAAPGKGDNFHNISTLKMNKARYEQGSIISYENFIRKDMRHASVADGWCTLRRLYPEFLEQLQESENQTL